MIFPPGFKQSDFDFSQTQVPRPSRDAARTGHRHFEGAPGLVRARTWQRWSTDASASPAKVIGAGAPGAPRSNSAEHRPELRSAQTPDAIPNTHTDWPELPSAPDAIPNTHTVRVAEQILRAAREASVPVSGDRPAADYFLASTDQFGGYDASAPLNPEQQLYQFKQLLAFLTRLDASLTFRQLVRLGVSQGHLSTDALWTVKIAPPVGYQSERILYADDFLPDQVRHALAIPLMDKDPVHGAHYLSQGGELRRMDKRACILRALVCLMTGETTTPPVGWMAEDGNVDPLRVAKWGVLERSGPDYLTQRIIRELNLDIPAWLSPLPFGDGNMATPPGQQWPKARFNDAMQQAIHTAGGVGAIASHAAGQDGYLESKFPIYRLRPHAEAVGLG